MPTTFWLMKWEWLILSKKMGGQRRKTKNIQYYNIDQRFSFGKGERFLSITYGKEIKHEEVFVSAGHMETVPQRQ